MSDLPPLPPNIASITAPLLFGNLFSFLLFGVLCAQVYVYAVAFPQDKKSIKFLVYGVFIFEAVQTALVAADNYYWFASGFGDMRHLANPYISPYDTPFMCAIVAFVVQSWFCYRIWIMRRNLFPLLLFIICVSVAQLVAAIIGVYLAQRAGNFDVAQRSTEVVYIWLAGSAIADVLIAGIMTHLLLSSRRADQPRTAHMLTRLAAITVETNSLTAGFAVLSLVIFAACKNTNWFTAPTYVIGKLYSNTLLVTFNNRIFLRRDNISSAQNSTQLACAFPVDGNASSEGRFTQSVDSRKALHVEDGPIVTVRYS